MIFLRCFLFFVLLWGGVTFAQVPLAPQKLDWFGDIRYRMAKGHEAIDEERSYQQLRVRLGVVAEVNEDVRAVIRLATANSAINQDQTLGDSAEPGMVRRGFGIDLAYIDWNFLRVGHVWAGRTANPFWDPGGSQLIYSDELAFEGLAIKWNPQWSHSAAFINLGAFIISENYAAPQDLVDTGLFGGEAGWKFSGDSWSLTTHVANYYFLNIQDKPITSFDKTAAVDPYSYPVDSYRGNSIYPNDPLLPADQRKYYFENKYVLHEIGTEWSQQVGDIRYAVFFDWVHNDKVHQQGVGFEYGLNISWKRLWFSAIQASKARDAVVGAFTDAYMNGGGTDTRGNRLQLGVNLAKGTSISLTQYQAKRGVDSVDREFSLTQAELNVVF